jgi:two-component system LytT family response regulator
VTAYSEFALPAIKASALDYLLKPVNRKELDSAIERFRKRTASPAISSDLESFKKMFKEEHERELKRVPLPTPDGYELIPIKDILYLVADRNYCQVHLKNGKTKLSTRHLGAFEELLADFGFLRVHKSFIVNLREIKVYRPGNGGQLTMTDGNRLEVSRRRKEQLIHQLQIDISKTA